MGLVVIEGVIIAVLVLTGLRTAVFRAVPTQLKTAIGVGIGLFLTHHRPGRRRLRPARPGRGEHHRSGRAGHRRQAGELADAGLRGRPAAHAGAGGPPGEGRDPDRHPRLDRAGDRSWRRSRNVGPSFVNGQPNPKGWSLNVPELPKTVVGPAGPVAARQVQRARLVGPGRLAGRADVRLHAADHGLLRHHGHDGRGRPGGRPARRAGHAAADQGDPAGRLDRRGGRRRGQHLQQHVVHRERRRCRGGRPDRRGQPGHRRAVPAGDVPGAAGRGRAVRGGVDGAGGGRLPDDDRGADDRLDRLRDRASRRSSPSC